MSRNVKVVFSGDMTKLRAAVIRARHTIKKFALKVKASMQAIGRSIKKLSFAAFRAGAMGAVAALGGLLVTARGLKKALDLGGRLSDVASNTGIAAGKALIMEQALQDAGMSGEKLQTIIQKQQRSIVEAGEGVTSYKKAFDALGLSLSDLRSMSPDEQFMAIQQALAALPDPAERSARAMQIFGRAGGQLGALFSNADAFKNAAESVGSQADILSENADAFDRSADILGGISGKVRSFFVGVAAQVNSSLLPLLEELNKVDMAQWGQVAGDAIMIAVQASKSGKLLSLGGSMLKIALIEGVNVLWRTIKAAVTFLGVGLAEGAMLIGKMLANTDFTDGVIHAFNAGASLLKAAAYEFIALTTGFGEYKNLAEAERGNANVEAYLAKNSLGKSGVADELSAALGRTLEAAAASYTDGDDLISTSSAKTELADKITALRDSVEAQRAASKSSSTAKLPSNESPEVTVQRAAKSAGSFAESKARVGGGGRVFAADNRAFAESRRQTKLQERTAKATEKLANRSTPTAQTAIYA